MKKELLEQLAALLETGELIGEFTLIDFNNKTMGIFPVSVERNGKMIDNCGTAQCAVGNLPIITDDAFFGGDGVLYLRNKATWYEASLSSIAAFFMIPIDVVKHLFYSDQQNTKKYGGVILKHSASRHEVAYNIRDFLKKSKG